MTTERIARSAFAAVLLAILTLAPALATAGVAQEKAGQVRYTGTIVGTTTGATMPFTLTLTGLTSREDLLRYAQIARTRGQDGLMDVLDDRDLGTFAPSGQVGRDVRLAYVKETPEGRRLVLLLERWIEPFEIRYGIRPTDYPFTYLEIGLNREDAGTGTVFGAARVEFDEEDPGLIDVERFGYHPARIIGVKRQR